MKRKKISGRVRTIYDPGAEEYGRPQLDWTTIGGSPEFLDDGDFDFDCQQEATSRDGKFMHENNMSKQQKLIREKRGQYDD